MPLVILKKRYPANEWDKIIHLTEDYSAITSSQIKYNVVLVISRYWIVPIKKIEKPSVSLHIPSGG
jgi:hypothetical protein